MKKIIQIFNWIYVIWLAGSIILYMAAPKEGGNNAMWISPKGAAFMVSLFVGLVITVIFVISLISVKIYGWYKKVDTK